MVKQFILIFLAILCQVTLFPAYLEDPFKPNLMIILVSYLALREESVFLGGGLAYFLGLLQDVFNGIYLGLGGFSLLLLYCGLRKIAGQLYTDSEYLILLVVFLASIIDGVVTLILLMLFSSSGGIYTTLLSSLLPQATVNALIASLIFGFLSFGKGVES
jgi:rod shape-determining protein MreD